MTQPLDAIAIILARAGSKGLPGKNTANIAGKPCLTYTINHALHSTHIKHTVLSTDCPHAAQIATDLGVTIIDRPTHLACDTATIDDAARHALSAVNPPPSTPVVILYANIPIRPQDLSDRALTLLSKTSCHSVQSYAPVGKYHPWWTVKLNSDASVAPWQGQILNHNIFRRQDLPPAHIPDGGIIALTQPALNLQLHNIPKGPHAFLGSDRRAITTQLGQVIDIDSHIDLIVAQTILENQHPSPTC